MPKEITDKLAWLFILLPGFLTVSIIGLIVDLGQLSEFQITFYSFILTLVISLISFPTVALVQSLAKRKYPTIASPESSKSLFFFSSTVISVALGIFFGLAAEGDRFFLTLRALPITDNLNKRSSSRPLVFLLSQNTAGRLKLEGDARPKDQKQTEAWARVQMKDGLIYEGWPEFYSVANAPSELYLSPACRIQDAKQPDNIERILGPGVIIVESEIRSLELIDRKSSHCFLAYYPQPKK